jgi:hypothetical protein
MKKLLIGLFLLFATFASSQSVTITVDPQSEATHSDWIWNDECQCWIWNGPYFDGFFEGHNYEWWHQKHAGGERARPPYWNEGNRGDRGERPHSELPKRPEGDTRSSTGTVIEQPKNGVEKPEAPKVETPKIEAPRPEHPKVEQSRAEQSKQEQHEGEKAKDGH